MDRLSIVLPTMGRPTLDRTLGSIVPQMEAGDELLIVSDGFIQSVVDLSCQYHEGCDGNIRLLVHRDILSVVGQAQRNRALESATADYLTFIGDDDVYTPGAFQAIREAVREQPGAFFFFRWESWQAGLLWREKIVGPGKVGDHSFVCPVRPKGGLGRFTHEYEGDYVFIMDTIDRQRLEDHPIVWKEDIISVCRPERFEERDQ